MRRFEGFEKGVNFGGWFSQCDHSQKRYDSFVSESDFAELSSWGLDHVRLPVDYNLVESEEGEYIESGFERIENVIKLCRKNNLNLILDLHKTAGFSFDKNENESGLFTDKNLQERFYRLWEQFASRFSKYGNAVAFELLNEITDKEYSPAWNKIAGECIRRIRKISPDVYILVGSYWNNSIDALADLDTPCDDKIVYNFHCYEPFLFTHQSAYWVSGMPSDFKMHFPVQTEFYKECAERVNIPSSPAVASFKGAVMDASLFDALFSKAVAVAQERNALLYCGEYGVIDNADLSDTVEWYKAINSCFVKYNIARAAWSYREMDFGLSDERVKPVLSEIQKYL